MIENFNEKLINEAISLLEKAKLNHDDLSKNNLLNINRLLGEAYDIIDQVNYSIVIKLLETGAFQGWFCSNCNTYKANLKLIENKLFCEECLDNAYVVTDN